MNLDGVKQIRIHQMREGGNKIARLVVDLDDVKRINHQIVTEGQDVKILIPAIQSSPIGTDRAPSTIKPTAASVQGLAPSSPAAVQAPSQVKTPAAAKPEPQAKPPAAASATKPKPAPEPAASTKASPVPKQAVPAKPNTVAEKAPAASTSKLPQHTETAAQVKPVAAKPVIIPKPEPQVVKAAPVPKPKPAVEQPAPNPKAPAASAAPVTTRPAAPRSVTPESRPPLQVAEVPTHARKVSAQVEREEPAQVPGMASRPAQAVASPVPPAQPIAPQVRPEPAPAPPAPVATQESRFSGSPLTLDLIDIPLVDFFRLMAEEGGINIVMDPEIKGSLSIKVVKVPWDQILEAALMNNALDKQIEGNLVRIAKKTTLQSEAKQREDLKKANVLAADIETRIKRLNYAKASTFLETLKEQKSVRGTVSVDERTNSLILTDIPNVIDKMSRLVESLDIPQPQVEIEARIVSANRDFARDLGVQFGFVQGNLQRTSVGGPNTYGTIGGTRPSQTPNSAYVAGDSSTGRGASETKASLPASVQHRVPEARTPATITSTFPRARRLAASAYPSATFLTCSCSMPL